MLENDLESAEETIKALTLKIHELEKSLAGAKTLESELRERNQILDARFVEMHEQTMRFAAAAQVKLPFASADSL